MGMFLGASSFAGFDASAGITNLGLADFRFNVEGDFVVLTVREANHGNTDLNGDGDTNDDVLHIFDASTDITTNLGLDAYFFRVAGNLVAFPVREANQASTDLNGDGDSDDNVLHVFDPSTGTITNLGLAAGNVYLDDGNLMAFAVLEADEGNTDLNGDGDSIDNVVHVFDPSTGTITNLGLHSKSVHISGNLVELLVSENDQGHTDLNGDGDSFDPVSHVFDASTGITTNPGLAAFNVGLEGNLLVLAVNELYHGSTDLNGDGDSGDSVLHIFDASTGTITNLGLAINHFLVRNGLVPFTVFESYHGNTDLNGDGDTDDHVLHVFDPSTGTTTNLGLDSSWFFPGGGNLVRFTVREANQGNTDLNGDGDSADEVLHIFDSSTGTTTNLGLDAISISIEGNSVVFTVREAYQANADLNGDGDTNDDVLHIFDASTGIMTNWGMAGYNIRIEDDLVAFEVRESEQGSTDLNGDGDSSDNVLHIFDTSTDTAINLELAAFGVVFEGDLLAFEVNEADQGNTDLNGDGDSSDFVLHVLQIEITPGGTQHPPPGQGGTPPGEGGTPPGLPDPPPGQGGDNPGQDGCAPDCAPGQKKKDK
jgi:hypothetical protein